MEEVIPHLFQWNRIRSNSEDTLAQLLRKQEQSISHVISCDGIDLVHQNLLIVILLFFIYF